MSNLAYIDDTRKWRYKDIKDWDDDNRYEIINGKLYMLASPSTIHQMIIVKIATQIANYLDGKPCEPFIAPMNVFLDGKVDESSKYIQPDIFVVCDRNKIAENEIQGAPDFVIEILSPSSTSKDKLGKFKQYEKYKVKEYWIVDPKNHQIQMYFLENDKYTDKGKYSFRKPIKSNLFLDLYIDLCELYDDKLYKTLNEESEEYINISQKLEEATFKYINYKLGKYEKQVLEYILSLKDKWDYEEDVMQLGAFRKLFELMDGDLVYRGYDVIHFPNPKKKRQKI